MKKTLWVVAALAFSLAVGAEEGGISQVGWSAGGKYLVSRGGKRRLRVHDGSNGRVLKAMNVPGAPTVFVSFSSDLGHEDPNYVTELAVSGNYDGYAGLPKAGPVAEDPFGNMGFGQKADALQAELGGKAPRRRSLAKTKRSNWPN